MSNFKRIRTEKTIYVTLVIYILRTKLEQKKRKEMKL